MGNPVYGGFIEIYAAMDRLQGDWNFMGRICFGRVLIRDFRIRTRPLIYGAEKAASALFD